VLAEIEQLSTAGPIYDVAIVGGGAAGLTLANALSGKGLKILVLEAGGSRKSRTSQQAYQGEVSDPEVHPALHTYRVRAIGGTSSIWGGRCIPFDEIDFAKRDWVPESGWPLAYRDIEPFYERASTMCESGNYLFDIAKALPHSPPELTQGLDGELLTTTLERFSKPTNFWTRFKTALVSTRDVHVVLAAAVVGIRLTGEGSAIDHLDVFDRERTPIAVRARAYVLAMGALETARLMLASNDVRASGVGNETDQVGRNYLSHLCTTAGTITFSAKDAAYDYERDVDGIYLRRRLWLNEHAQRKLQLLNTTFRTHLPEPADPGHGDPILSAMFLVKGLVQYEYARKFSERPVSAGLLMRHVGNMVRGPFKLMSFASKWTRDRILAERKLPSVVLGSSLNRYHLEFHAEQAPNRDSRVHLSGKRDALGMPQLKIDWQVRQLDIDSLKRCYRCLQQELHRTGTGTLDYDEDALEYRAKRHGIVGGHHIGTTRMSTDPRHGVVDADCRVHSVKNLYIASSSVFPTSSQANPTLTIVALALRLADHLRLELRHHHVG